MKAHRLKGKTIAKVHQSRSYRSDTGQYSGFTVDAIEFTDGTFASLLTVELGYDYGTTIVYPSKPPDQGAKS